MITAKQLNALKKSGVSVDTKKSSERIIEAFKSATTMQKSEIEKLSGLTKFGFYKGVSSPKTVIALAQILNIAPSYLIGESDSKDPCNDDLLNAFYKKCKDGDKIKTVKAKTATATKAKPAVKKAVPVKADKKPVTAPKKTATVITEKPVKAVKPAPAPIKPKAERIVAPAPAVKTPKTHKIDDELLVTLLKALSIRAKFGGEAEKTYNEVVGLLIK